MTSTTIMTEADAAELKAYRAKARRNAARRAHRAANRGEGFTAMAARIAAHVPDYAAEESVTLAELAENVVRQERALGFAVVQLVEARGYSWAQIGRELGISRQSAQERFGKLTKSTRKVGAQPANLR
jgi:AraC-like DNA-binding protein